MAPPTGTVTLSLFFNYASLDVVAGRPQAGCPLVLASSDNLSAAPITRKVCPTTLNVRLGLIYIFINVQQWELQHSGSDYTLTNTDGYPLVVDGNTVVSYFMIIKARPGLFTHFMLGCARIIWKLANSIAHY